MNTISRSAERLARMKMREQRRKNPATIRGQLNIEQAKTLEFDRRIASGQFGLLRPKEERESLPGPEDLDALPNSIEAKQISFIVQKKCLACKAVNLYCAITCRKCGGHFCYDKTAYVGRSV